MEFDRRELLTGLAATAAALPILPALPAGGVFPVNLDTPEPWSEAHTRAQRALVERLRQHPLDGQSRRTRNRSEATRRGARQKAVRFFSQSEKIPSPTPRRRF
jgi:hypothetical protein